MNKNISILGLILICTVLLLSLIYVANDHLECKTVVNKTFNSDGNVIKTEKYICKEKYNF